MKEKSLKYLNILLIMSIFFSQELFAVNCQTFVLSRHPEMIKCESETNAKLKKDCQVKLMVMVFNECLLLSNEKDMITCLNKKTQTLKTEWPKECYRPYDSAVREQIDKKIRERAEMTR